MALGITIAIAVALFMQASLEKMAGLVICLGATAYFTSKALECMFEHHDVITLGLPRIEHK
ncbi:hypothetical protein D3C87_1719760 [compost metagenome]